MDGDGLQGRAGDGLLVMVQRLESEGATIVLNKIPGDVLEVLEADFTAFWVLYFSYVATTPFTNFTVWFARK